MDSRDELIALMKQRGVPITRENYIEVAWGEPRPEWNAELETQLPDALQDWTKFEIAGAEAKPKK